jgi:RNAse (barnase) inhibitor barstar
MGVFRPGDHQRVDWRLLQNGAITLYYRPALLDEDIGWLQRHGYRVHQFDCSGWESDAAFHDAVSEALGFPGYYGRNIHAFNDCLCDIEVPDEGGCALVFRRYDHFASAEPEFAQAVLEDIQGNSRRLALWGKRLLAILQSDDPCLSFQPVGACSVMWNHREWLNAARGL